MSVLTVLISCSLPGQKMEHGPVAGGHWSSKERKAAFMGPFLYVRGAERVTQLWIYRLGPPAGRETAVGPGQHSGNATSICCHGLLISAC